MARTQRYLTRTAAGGGSGTAGSPWTFDEAIAAAAAGDDMNMLDDGTDWALAASKVIGVAGTAANPIRWRSHASTIGDGWQGFDSSGFLVRTNMVVLAFSVGNRLQASGNYNIFESLEIKYSNSLHSIVSGVGSWAIGCRVTNSSTTAAGFAVSGVDAGMAFCDVFQDAASGGFAAIWVGGASTAYGCRGKSTSGAAIRIDFGTGRGTVIHCVGYESGTHGLEIINTGASASALALHNTLYGNAGNGVDVVSGFVGRAYLIGNMITDNVGFGIDQNGAAAGLVYDLYNRFRDNAAGNLNLNADNDGIALLRELTDTGGAATDFNSAAGYDFRLVRQSPGHHWDVVRGLSRGASDPYAPAAGGVLGFGSA
jgi:hypothetical protein